ncbi:hypothetical protein [Salmonirosea aquatica]|uniref:Uncharacterized protein n=1 Tax=Salmonirosea aquatica TaxID=2654236 RepID=A0A7C9BGC8_9BACT|nr:hypothetical protein [Cytophagaceae bacterium SJW1-29]
MQEFLTIRHFSQEAQYIELLNVLQTHDIPYLTEEYRQRIDPISMVTLAPEFIVKVQAHHFSKVSELMNELAAQAVLHASDEHYLFDFKDEELFDILASPDEWSAFDYQLARRILGERGIEIDAKMLDLLKKSRLQELAQPEEKQTNSLWVAYFFAILGGVVGIFMGWHMLTARKTLPNGQRIYMYQASDRRHGRWIMALGLVMLVIWLLSKPLGGSLF